MAKAKIQLSTIARDPVVAAFFERGELDNGTQFAIPTAPAPVKAGKPVNDGDRPFIGRSPSLWHSTD